MVLQFVSGSKKRTATKELKGEAQTDWSGVRRTQGAVADRRHTVTVSWKTPLTIQVDYDQEPSQTHEDVTQEV